MLYTIRTRTIESVLWKNPVRTQRNTHAAHDLPSKACPAPSKYDTQGSCDHHVGYDPCTKRHVQYPLQNGIIGMLRTSKVAPGLTDISENSA